MSNTNTAASVTHYARVPRPARATLLGQLGVWDVYTRTNDNGDQELLARHSAGGPDRPMPVYYALIMAGRKNGSEFWASALRLMDTHAGTSSWDRPKALKKTRHGRDHSGDLIFVREHYRRRPSS